MRTNKYLEALQEFVSSKDMSYCNCGKTNQIGGFSCKQHCKHGKGEELSRDVFDNPGEAMKRAKEMGLEGVHNHKNKDGKNVFMPGKTHDEYLSKKKIKADKPGPKDPRRTPAPTNPNYKQDNDLLPKGHPRSSK